MKKLLLIILGVVFLFACSNDENDWTNSQLNGKIKSISEKHYDAKDSFSVVVKEKLSFTYEIFYNKHGNMTEDIYYDTAGATMGSTKCEYNEDQKLIWIKRYSDQGVVFIENQYVYDESGKLTFLINLSDGNFLSKGQLIYDEDGILIERRSYNDEAMQKLVSSSKLYYDSKGNNTEVLSYDGTGKLTGKITMLYDKNNFMIETANYSPSDELLNKYMMDYDKYGNLTELINYDENGVLVYSDITEYEYDKKGNWIKSYQHTNSAATTGISEREIVYY